MKAKKFFYALAALFCCLSLTSCGDDDDDILPAEKTITKAYLCVTAKPSAEQLSVADLTLKYTDAEGKEITDVVNETTWERKVTVTKFPVNATFTYNCKKKEGATINSEASYKMSRQLLIKVIVDYSDGSTGTIWDDNILPFDNYITINGSKVENWLTNHATLATKKIAFDDKGKNLSVN